MAGACLAISFLQPRARVKKNMLTEVKLKMEFESGEAYCFLIDVNSISTLLSNLKCSQETTRNNSCSPCLTAITSQLSLWFMFCFLHPDCNGHPVLATTERTGKIIFLLVKLLTAVLFHFGSSILLKAFCPLSYIQHLLFFQMFYKCLLILLFTSFCVCLQS